MIINLEWYRKFLVVFVVAVFYTSVCEFTQRVGINPLKWMIVFIVLSAPVVIHAVLNLKYRIPPLGIWTIGFLLISFLWYVPGPQDSLAFQQLQTRMLSIIFLFLVLLIVSRAGEQHFARVCVVFAVLFGTALNIYELFNPMTWSNVPGRSMGLYSNINQSGCALMLGMIIGQSVVPARLRVPFALLAGVGVVTTFSRAAILGWILVVGFWAVRSGINPRKIAGVLFVLALLFGFFTSSYWSNIQSDLEMKGSINTEVLQRISFFGNQGNASDDSAEEREAVASTALRVYERGAIFGQGTGAGTGRSVEGFNIGPHNIYLALGIDHGLIGIFLIPLMLLAMLWKCPKSVFDIAAPMALFVTLWGFFSHNVHEEFFVLFSIALTGSIVYGARSTAAARRAAVAPQTFALQPFGAAS